MISGDALCDFDLSAAVAFHRKKQAQATLLVKRVGDPREYGWSVPMRLDASPVLWKSPPTRRRSASLPTPGSICFRPEALRKIPREGRYDFAKDLFARMLAEGDALYAYEEAGYWCDIGDIDTYLRCQRDLLEGKVQSSLRRDEAGNVIHPPRGCTRGPCCARRFTSGSARWWRRAP